LSGATGEVIPCSFHGQPGRSETSRFAPHLEHNGDVEIDGGPQLFGLRVVQIEPAGRKNLLAVQALQLGGDGFKGRIDLV